MGLLGVVEVGLQLADASLVAAAGGIVEGGTGVSRHHRRSHQVQRGYLPPRGGQQHGQIVHPLGVAHSGVSAAEAQ
jgi:hypothetical protein